MHEDEQDKNPEDQGPFKKFRILGRGKVQVQPDPMAIRPVVTMEEKPGYTASFRRWVLRNHVQVYALFLIIAVLAYEVPAYYYPLATNYVVAILWSTLIFTYPFAYDWEKRRDQAHNVFVDEIRLQLKETTVGRQKGPNGVEQKVLISDATRRAIYLAKDYMFDPKEPNRIEKSGTQIVDTGWGKIVDVDYVDDSGRIIVGPGDGDIPSGMILKIAYPSRTELSKEVATAKKMAEEHVIPYSDFVQFKAHVEEYNAFRDTIIEEVNKKGFGLIDLDRMTKKQKSYFVALDKYSLPFWNPKDGTMGLSDWLKMPASIKLPKVMTLQRSYDEIKNEKIDLILFRESDKQDNKVEAIIDVEDSLGVTDHLMKQYGVQRSKRLSIIPSSTEKGMQERMTDERESQQD